MFRLMERSDYQCFLEQILNQNLKEDRLVEVSDQEKVGHLQVGVLDQDHLEIDQDSEVVGEAGVDLARLAAEREEEETQVEDLRVDSARLARVLAKRVAEAEEIGVGAAVLTDKC